MTFERLHAASDVGGNPAAALNVLCDQAAAYTEWLAAEVQESIDDPRPGIAHKEVMSRLCIRIARIRSGG